MGTSVSQPSPPTTNWNAVATAYTNDAVPVDRLVRELWRASRSEITADWGALLAQPVIAACLNIAIRSESAASAATLATREIVRRKASSIATDIARRAVIQSFSLENRGLGFAQALFSGVGDYLVSRDISGYIGEAARNESISDTIRFKTNVRERIAAVVQALDIPARPETEEEWQRLVTTAVSRLAE